MSSEDQQSGKKVPQRLPSLRGLRDLSLKDAGHSTATAAAAKKRTFTPVLPTQAKTKVVKEFVSEFDPPPELKMKPGYVRPKPNPGESSRGTGRGRGRGRGQESFEEAQFVQMKSVFAEGPMQRQDAFIKSAYRGSFGPSREGHTSLDGGSGGGGGGAKSRLSGRMKMEGSSKGDAMDCKDDVASLLDDLLRDDFISDAPTVIADAEMAPVVFPRPDEKISSSSSKIDIKNKQEAMDVDKDKCIGFDITSVNSNELILLQLPDVLPGVPFEKALQSKDSAAAGTDQVRYQLWLDGTDQKFTLSDFEESRIGELVVRRSGKMQLVVNNVVFDVIVGTKSTFLQELVSVQFPEESSSSDLGLLSVLGHVRHKLLCIADFDRLLGESQTNAHR